MEEEYNWRERNQYQYDALYFLDPIKKNIKSYKQNKVVVYTVNNENNYPFLQFLFFKNFLTNEFILPSYIHFGNELKPGEIITYIKDYLCNLINKDIRKLVGRTLQSEIKPENIKFDGFLELEDNYLFFNVKNLEQYIYLYTLEQFQQTLFLGLVYDILNVGKIDDRPIYFDDLQFFKRNSELLYLSDNDMERYETPIVGYCFKPNKKLNFTYTFGLSADINGRIGDYYYFKNYEGAKQELSENKETPSGGIIRFALFIGKMKVLMNDLEYPERNDISQQNIDDFINWCDYYDCIYYLENKNPVWVVKDFHQQIPLACMK